jgi:eukaryotic-like serine/threonine-protein kinase
MPHPSQNEHPSKKGSAEVISPLSIQGPSRGQDRLRPERHRLRNVLLLGLVLIAIVALGGWLLHYLKFNPIVAVPDTPPPVADDKSITALPDSVKPAPSIPAVSETATQAMEKAQAERQRDEFSRVTSTLENKGVSEWGGTLYSEMITLGREAYTLLSQNDYNAATDRYAAALKNANLLVGRMPAALQRFIEEGLAALTEGDGQMAQNNFQAALLLDPDNTDARHGLARAAQAEAVKRLVESATAHESDRNDALALVDYRQALALDPEAERAIAGRIRVQARLEETKFQHLMSAGLAALAQNDLQTARSRLLEARAIRPDDPGVVDALAQTDQAIRLNRIENLRQTAIRAEQSEDWEQALASYQNVLELDGNIRFAVQGTARAQDYIRINKRIRFFLEKPGALEADRQLQNALALLDETGGLKVRGPRLNARIEQLKALVETAQTPVRLTIESDNNTEVAVYKIGKFGRFTVHELFLRPGTYTVVGSRDGYQDVRKILRVESGQQPQRISVICKVKV